MRLKSLEMQGFKSFPDKTVVSFDRGITVVVGPNGSGKSNLSDAMRWVLGEMSTKNIRGSKMEDVVFAGSQKRSPMGYAEVSVTFDNTEDAGKISGMDEYDEITVTRRYYRVGDSEYFINRKPVRLKDINELFMNTGIGRGGYSIIGQGRIAEIISSKSEDRRSIFEEAAGIAKYRYQKQEAEKKLESTLENLVRLEDIESELETRVGPLEKEAEKAKKYLEIRDEKKALDLSLSIYDIDGAKAESSELEKKLAVSKNELERSDETLSDLEKRDETLFSDLQSNKTENERVSGDISSLTERIYSLESDEKIASGDNVRLNEQLLLSGGALEEKTKALASARDEEKKRAQDAEKAEETKNALSKQKDEISSKADSLADEITSHIQKIDALTERYEQTKTSDTEAKIAQSVAASQREANLGKCSELSLEISKHDDDIKLFVQRIDKAKIKIAGYTEKLNASSAVTEKSAKKKEALLKTSKELAAQKNDIYLEISQRKHQAANLLRMEELFEGYSRAVRFLMTEYKQGNVRDKNGDTPKIYGPVSQFVTVDGKYSAALEVAFGQSLQNIIVEDEQCAKAGIEFLKRRSAGRATFYPLTTMKGNPLDEKSLGIGKYKGYIAVASTLVTCEDRFRGITDYLTGRIIVADNMDNASVIARFLGFKYKVVTIDGQVINAGGSYTGGSVSNDTQMLSRRAQIDRLGAEVASLEKESAETEKAIAENEAALEEIRKEEQAELGTYSMIKTLCDAESTQMQILESNKAVITESRDQLQKQYEELSRLAEKDGGDAEEYIEMRRRYENLLAEIEKELCDERRERTGAEKKLENVRARLSDCSVDLAREEKNAEMCSAALATVRTKAEEILRDTETLKTQIEQIKANISENESKIAESSAAADEIREKIGQITSEKSRLSEDSLSIERKLTEVRAKQKELTHTRELIFREFANLDASYKRACEKQDKLVAFLWDEYEVTYTEACEAGYEKITEKSRHEAVSRQNKLKNAMKALGDVHVGAIEEYKEVKSRYETLSAQTKDLRDSKEELYKIVSSLEERMKEDFQTTFDEINRNFTYVFKELFGGGTAELKLSDRIDVLNSGIEINVAPPGKVIKNMSLLSGGEQAFVAIALYFAILKVTPTPFCILDEIEAALDEVNVDKFAQYVKNYSEKTQFVIITHRRGTMDAADRIYGVTMHEKGISDVLSIDVSEIEARIGEKPE